MLRDLLAGPRAFLLFGLVACAVPACGSEGSTEGERTAPGGQIPGRPGDAPGPSSEGQSPPPSFDELPWEVVSSKGESLVPDVFYAEASQNEQIMPYAIRGHVMIDRLIYPTIGNPNPTPAPTRPTSSPSSPASEDAFEHLAPELPRSRQPLRALTIEKRRRTARRAAVSRDARDGHGVHHRGLAGRRHGVYRVVPSKIREPRAGGHAAQFKVRKTLRSVFDQAAMAKVPAGLYDVRIEPRKAGARSSVGPSRVQYNAVRVRRRAGRLQGAQRHRHAVSVGALYKEKSSTAWRSSFRT